MSDLKTYIAPLISGDLKENTMTFEIQEPMALKFGLYAIVPIEEYKKLANEDGKETEEALVINDVGMPKGTLPLDKFIKNVEAYELEQQTHPIERTPERMRTILCATHWCKEIAKRLTK